MPPRSRGSRHNNPAHGFRDPLAAHPTLTPFLDNLASPSSTISDQRTPTGNGYSDRPETPPDQPRNRRDTITSVHDDGESDYDPDLDDADFQSHYSLSANNSDSESLFSGSDEAPRSTSPSIFQDNNILQHSVSSRSLPPPPPPLPLFPPFYNRPPTPLPPSPSLTSLLRPPSLLNRSTTSTRPTTPDSSDVDVETPNDTEAAVAHSARRATIVSRVSPKVPTYEYYGFVSYLASSLGFVLYLLWSYLPSPFLAAIGLQYYPNRWWSLAIPAFLVMLIVYIYIALLSYNVEYLTLPMGSVECMVDEAANIALLDAKGKLRKGGSKLDLKAGSTNGLLGGGGWEGGQGTVPGNGLNGAHRRSASTGGDKIDWRNLWNEGTDAVMDIPIGGVCQVLYGESRDPDPALPLDRHGDGDGDGFQEPEMMN